MNAEPAIRAGEALYTLAGYQLKARDALRDTVKRIAGLQVENPAQRETIALELGVVLLQAPTAAGKTLILGRTLESLRGAVLGKFAWFWFTPFVGLVEQTKDALSSQCPSLRLRDVAKDRTAASTRDGDIFVQTWATVAANNANARKVRRRAEDSASIDDLIADLRDKGFSIGVVIDEAHVNFGTSAKAAAEFYLNVLKPDATILATATPNDDKLEAFEKEAGIRVESRVVVDRKAVVDAGLNKVGLVLGIVRFGEEDSKLVDPEQAALAAGWARHKKIKNELTDRGIAVTPLMLVQVEDQKKGEADPVGRVREKLLQLGVPATAIKSHTSGKPDPDFHAFAHDPNVEVLIFKVAVATGFDAPRAWILVSVRPNRGVEFGLQIVGRIMRVHPAVRHLHKTVPLLDNGFVVLTDPELQGGLDAAVAELKAVRESIDTITDHLNVVQFGSGAPVLQEVQAIDGEGPVSSEERSQRIDQLVEQGVLFPSARNETPEFQDRLLKAVDVGATGDLFGDLPIQQLQSKSRGSPARSREALYRLRTDLDLPETMKREELPALQAAGADFAEMVGREFVRRIPVADYLLERGRAGELRLRELFQNRSELSERLNVPISAARVDDLAQAAFQFNDQIDPRDLKRSILRALERAADERAVPTDERMLRRGVALAALEQQQAMRDAVRAAQRLRMTIEEGEAIPANLVDVEGLERADKAAHGIFPSGMNRPESAFARLLDKDSSGTVLWWLRCKENTKWAPKLVLPDGSNFFPDFAVGVARRSKADGVALIEIKDDGETGRLQSDRNTIKARVDHSTYGKVFWGTVGGEDLPMRLLFDDRVNRFVPTGKFDLVSLVYD